MTAGPICIGSADFFPPQVNVEDDEDVSELDTSLDNSQLSQVS